MISTRLASLGAPKCLPLVSSARQNSPLTRFHISSRISSLLHFVNTRHLSSCPVTGPSDVAVASSSKKVELQEVPTLPYLGSLVSFYSNTPVIGPTSFYDYYPTMRKRYGDFYKMGMPGLGKGAHGIVYVMTDPNEMQKVIRQERGKQPYPRGIVESEWPLVDWLHSKGSILGKTPEQVDRFKSDKSFRLNVLSNVVRGGTYEIFINLIGVLVFQRGRREGVISSQRWSCQN